MYLPRKVREPPSWVCRRELLLHESLVKQLEGFGMLVATPIPRGELARYLNRFTLWARNYPPRIATVEKKGWDLEEFLNEVLRLICFSWRTCIDVRGYFSLEPTARVSCFQNGLDAKVFFLETHSLPFAKVTQLPPAEQAHRPASLASSRHGTPCPHVPSISKKKWLPPRIHLHHLPCKNRISILM